MKLELVSTLALNRDELLRAFDGLSEKEITTIPVVGCDASSPSKLYSGSCRAPIGDDASWTIKDTIGHISYWEQVIHAHVRESFAEGKPRRMSDKDPNDAINAREAKRRKNWKWARVRAEFENTRGALIARVESLSEMDLSFVVPNPWWNQNGFYSVAQMIEDDAIGHCREHIEQIRNWKLEIRG
ncbi:MAG: DinB family protein [Chloroflexi bacterium]|nr:DinB family protein [Chloroflexota bacterium]MBI3740614.1 DinB family protein [Chloroflexota bacterium]